MTAGKVIPSYWEQSYFDFKVISASVYSYRLAIATDITTDMVHRYSIEDASYIWKGLRSNLEPSHWEVTVLTTRQNECDHKERALTVLLVTVVVQ